MKPGKNIANQFKLFIDEEYSKLIHYVRSQINEAYYDEYAEDIVQDVALNIYSKLDINTPVENLAGYFYRSLHNRLIDLKRKPRKKVSIENYNYEDSNENILLAQYSKDNQDVPSSEEQEEKDMQLMDAIDKLRPEYREVIMATEFEGLSYEQLSKQTNLPIGTLLSRKHRAIAQLAEIMNTINNT